MNHARTTFRSDGCRVPRLEDCDTVDASSSFCLRRHTCTLHKELEALWKAVPWKTCHLETLQVSDSHEHDDSAFPERQPAGAQVDGADLRWVIAALSDQEAFTVYLVP
jgi:hypothetical protein